MPGGNRPRRRLHVDPPVSPGHLTYLGARQQVAPGLPHLSCVGLRDLAVVDNPRVGREDRLDARGVGLDLQQALPVNHLEVQRPVGCAPPVELVQAVDLRLVGGDDQLAAHLVLDAVLVAKLPEKDAAGGAEIGLLGAGSVVDAGVDHAAVVTRLVLGYLVLFFDDRNLVARMLLRETHRGGKTDNPAADYADVVVSRVGGHPCGPRLPLLLNSGKAVPDCITGPWTRAQQPDEKWRVQSRSGGIAWSLVS